MAPALKIHCEKYPLQSYFHLKRDPISFLSGISAECGDFARVHILMSRFYLVNDPDLIREALIEKNEALIIKGGVSSGLARLIGDGILTNHGENWRESRKTLQPLFNQDALDAHARIMPVRVQESLDRWKAKFSGELFPISLELLMLSTRITCSTLFRYVPTFEEAEKFSKAILVLQNDGMSRHMIGLDFAEWIPVPINGRVKRARNALRELADRCIASGAEQKRDEILSILFAGTESVTNTLCWAMKLLDDHPDCQGKLIQSSDYLSQFISETLRLYPAGWAFERFADQETSLGGVRIPRGSRLLFSPFLLHRNPRFWKNPDSFDPERFSGQLSPVGVPKYAYLPFGAGPRSCIGGRLAWAEMRTILEMLYTQCRWKIESLPGGSAFVPQGAFKIRLSGSLMARASSIHTPSQSRDGN